MTLEEVLAVMEQAEREQKTTVRLHTGDPCLYGAIQEQMDALRQKGIPYAVTPGVSSFCAAAAALPAEYTLPGVSQTVILTRMAGRTPVPEREEIAGLAAHGASMAIFLSAGMLPELSERLIAGGYSRTRLPPSSIRQAGPTKSSAAARWEHSCRRRRRKGSPRPPSSWQAAFEEPYRRSRLYDPGFSHAFRRLPPQRIPHDAAACLFYRGRGRTGRH